MDPEQQRAKEQALQMQSLVRKLDEKNRKIESLCVLLEVGAHSSCLQDAMAVDGWMDGWIDVGGDAS